MSSSRNLDQEVDEIRGRMDQMAEGQSRLEDLLRHMAESLKTNNGTATGNGAHTTAYKEVNPGEDSMNGEGENDANNVAHGPTFKIKIDNSERDKLKDELIGKMQEQIKAIQGPNLYGPVGINELCPEIEVDIPKDFKVPDFTKYDGSTNPRFHLKTYLTKMAMWSRDPKFLINFFHESLTGPALEWFMQVEHTKISSWDDLTTLFLGQYRFNIDTAPTREQLAALHRRNDEAFRQYAQRWRMLAAQVQPSLTPSEMCSYFMGTLGSPFIGLMAGAVYKDFSDMISAGERIESLAKAGKLPVASVENSFPKKVIQAKKKESEVSYVQRPSPRPPFIPQSYPTYRAPTIIPQASQTPYSTNNIPPPRPYTPNRPNYAYRPPPTQAYPNQGHVRPQNNLPPFPKLPITNADLFQQLFDAHLVACIPSRPMTPPFPTWYNPSVTCKFHMDNPGHSIENCEAFKTVVRKLIACGKFSIEEDDEPSITGNPMPKYGKGAVNAIEKEDGRIRNVEEVQTSMKQIFWGLVEAGYMTPQVSDREKGFQSCEYHAEEEHDIEECLEFRKGVQELMKLGIVDVTRPNNSEKEVNTVERFVLKIPRASEAPNPKNVVVVIKKAAPFPYKDTHAVPWRYDVKVEVRGQTSSTSMTKPAQVVSNLGDIDGITRSGRFYGQEDQTRKGKEPLIEEKLEGEEEFLKIMKQSEYDIVEQLRKTPARISLLSLIMSSEPHRKALQKVLNEAYVKPDITPNNMVSIVDPVKHANVISFFEKEVVPSKGSNASALHITLRCKGYIIAKVLIDGGSALNVLPKSTLSQLAMGTDDLTPQDMVVRAFDGRKRGILGEVTLPLEIGPSCFQVLFQVMEIEPAYTMLLGRPWIHAAGAVPSTLHQCLKYMENGCLITIRGEGEIMLTKPTSVPYVENTEQEEDNFLHNFQLVGSEEESEGSSSKDVHQVVARIMKKNGYQNGKGLGACLQGAKSTVMIPENRNRFGLGYEPSVETMMEHGLVIREMEKEMASKRIPHLKETFPMPAEVIHEVAKPQIRLIINSLEEDLGEEPVDQPLNSSKFLNNWRSEPLIDVIAKK